MKPLPFDLPPEYVPTFGQLAAECDVSRWTLAEVRNRDKRFPRKTPYGWPVYRVQNLLDVRLLEGATDEQYDAALKASGQVPTPGARQEAIDYWLAMLHETTSAHTTRAGKQRAGQSGGKVNHAKPKPETSDPDKPGRIRSAGTEKGQSRVQ